MTAHDIQKDLQDNATPRQVYDPETPNLNDSDEDITSDTSAPEASTHEEGTSSSPPPADHVPLGSLSPQQPLLGTMPVPPQRTLHGYFHLSAKHVLYDPTPSPPRPQTLKRQRSQGEEGDLPMSKKSRPQGTSKSALAEAKSRAEADKGVIDHQKFERFKKKILTLDPHAEFLVDNNPRFVLHSKCAEVNKQKAPYNTTNFINHVRACAGPSKKRVHVANTDKKCFTGFVSGGTCVPLTGHATNLAELDTNLPCPGLTPEYDPKIATYLTRSQAAGGGSRPRHTISQEQFGKSAGDLDKDELARVCRLEATEFRWLNFREQGFIRATTCLKKSPSRQEPALPCSSCMTVSKDQIFKNALGRKLPKDENLKFTPRGCRAKLTGDQYAKMVGVYDLVRRASDVSCFLSIHRCNS